MKYTEEEYYSTAKTRNLHISTYKFGSLQKIQNPWHGM